MFELPCTSAYTYGIYQSKRSRFFEKIHAYLFIIFFHLRKDLDKNSIRSMRKFVCEMHMNQIIICNQNYFC